MDKVYFFTNGANIKIGYTKLNIEKRLKQLYPLGFVSGNKSLEKELHQKFAKFRIRNNGEWFYPDQSLIDYINSVNEIPNTCVLKNELFDNKLMACKTT